MLIITIILKVSYIRFAYYKEMIKQVSDAKADKSENIRSKIMILIVLRQDFQGLPEVLSLAECTISFAKDGDGIMKDENTHGIFLEQAHR